MSRVFNSNLWLAATLMQRAMMALVLGGAVLVLGWTIAAAAGFAPWLSIPMGLSGSALIDGGPGVQIALVVLLFGLAAFLPANARIAQLETSHRNFHIGMQDVARAYAAAHAGDRQGMFRMSSEFDSVRERIAFLRDHPDLGELEPSVLEVAAQMSHESRELAQIYSDEAVDRARGFLAQRQDEIASYEDRISHAKAIATEIRQWIDRIEIEESVARSQADRLVDELRTLLPEAFSPSPEPSTATAQATQDAAPIDDDLAQSAKVTPLLREAAE